MNSFACLWHGSEVVVHLDSHGVWHGHAELAAILNRDWPGDFTGACERMSGQAISPEQQPISDEGEQ